jgi:hypothetical protein
MEMNGTTILGALLAVLATFVLSTEGVPFARSLSEDELEHLGEYLNSINPKGRSIMLRYFVCFNISMS